MSIEEGSKADLWELKILTRLPGGQKLGNVEGPIYQILLSLTLRLLGLVRKVTR